MNPNLTIRCFTPADIRAVFELELAYAQVYPGALVIPAESYLSPAFHGGQDVLCAFDSADGGRLAAYAPVYVQLINGSPDLPHAAWAEIKARPGLADPQMVKDALYNLLVERARAVVAEANLAEPFPGRPLRMTFEYRTSETPAVDYVLARGFSCTESVFLMRRDLSAPVPPAPAPLGIGLLRWKMESETEQQAYISARNACFPEAPTPLEAWQYFMTSPQWAAGATIAAFDGDQLTGCVNVYWNEEEIQQVGVKFGYTEDIFVRPGWRGRGIARAMIAEGMRYLQEHGLAEAHLAVRALNDTALKLYTDLGYTVIQESRFYAKEI